MNNCLMCGSPVIEESTSFEQRLIGDIEFCRRCFDAIMDDTDTSYLDSPSFMSTITR